MAEAASVPTAPPGAEKEFSIEQGQNSEVSFGYTASSTMVVSIFALLVFVLAVIVSRVRNRWRYFREIAKLQKEFERSRRAAGLGSSSSSLEDVSIDGGELDLKSGANSRANVLESEKSFTSAASSSVPKNNSSQSLSAPGSAKAPFR